MGDSLLILDDCMKCHTCIAYDDRIISILSSDYLPQTIKTSQEVGEVIGVDLLILTIEHNYYKRQIYSKQVIVF